MSLARADAEAGVPSTDGKWQTGDSCPCHKGPAATTRPKASALMGVGTISQKQTASGLSLEGWTLQADPREMSKKELSLSPARLQAVSVGDPKAAFLMEPWTSRRLILWLQSPGRPPLEPPGFSRSCAVQVSFAVARQTLICVGV